jgi:hypothetical protein
MTGVNRRLRFATNEDWITPRIRYVYNGEPLEMLTGRFRAVRNDTNAEVFDVTPLQDEDGWIYGFVPAASVAAQTAGAARYDLKATLETEGTVNLLDGVIEIVEGVS